MFGPAILVSPVTESGVTTRSLYLPAAKGWYDFWIGKRFDGGQRILAPAPLDPIPLFIKAGSILPLGPASEYAGQDPNAPIELRVYPGANGNFDLHEDAGDSCAYEQGEHALIPIRWHGPPANLSYRSSWPTRQPVSQQTAPVTGTSVFG